MPQRQRLEVRQELGPKGVDDALGYAHLHLGMDHAHHLVGDLDEKAHQDDHHEEGHSAARNGCGE